MQHEVCRSKFDGPGEMPIFYPKSVALPTTERSVSGSATCFQLHVNPSPVFAMMMALSAAAPSSITSASILSRSALAYKLTNILKRPRNLQDARFG
jgi:hypothetical protein